MSIRTMAWTSTIVPGGEFDFAFSTIVFQHIPSRDVIENYVREVHRLLRPGALFKFQVQGDSTLETERRRHLAGRGILRRSRPWKWRSSAGLSRATGTGRASSISGLVLQTVGAGYPAALPLARALRWAQ